MEESTISSTFVIVGGGIAGITCAETISIACPDESITLISESAILKTVSNLECVTKCLYKFDVEGKDVNNYVKENSSAINVIIDTLKNIDSRSKHVQTQGGHTISYTYLCICTGGRPKLIESENEYVIGIRDTDSVQNFQKRLEKARKIVIVGNGGIATELVYVLKNIDIHWVIKDDHTSSTFLDAGAAEFFLKCMNSAKEAEELKGIVKRLRFDEVTTSKDFKTNKKGSALGPDWHKNFYFYGNNTSQSSLKIHYSTQIKSLQVQKNQSEEYPLSVFLTSGEEVGCDFLVSATGVYPCIEFTCNETISLSDDGFILVNSLMETSVNGVYAAGDVCSANWKLAENWFQMRLWTQARQMGSMAGRSMVAAHKQTHIDQDFCFELFGHTTTFFNFPVVLLGCFNGQKLGNNYELLLRSTPNQEYIKFVISDGRLRGAILIGNTELAEMCENLILNGLDLTPFGNDLLDPNIDIEDFFD